MQKINYLKYFKKTNSTTKPTEQSFDQNQITIDEQNISFKNQESNEISNEELNENLINYKNYTLLSQNKQLRNQINEKQFLSQKLQKTKNIRVHNKNSQIIKKRQQTQASEQIIKRKFQQFKKKSFQQKANSTISQGVKFPKTIKHLNQSLHSPQFQKQIQTSSQRIKTLQSTSLYNPCLTEQKFFTHPIKPYNRNKTAQNKKFRTLKTTFGDLNSSCRNYNDIYTISLQNLRMGWRIVNAKSMIEEYLNSTYFTYHLYNGNLINKQKFKNKESKQKKKFNFKQMKNVYKVFFNQNNLFNEKDKQNPKLLQSINKKDQVQQYILGQSQIKQESAQSSFCNSNQEFSGRNSPRSPNKSLSNKNQLERNSSHHKPCFFRNTYKQYDSKFNTRICEKQKQTKVKRTFKTKIQSNFIRKNKLLTQQNPVQTEEYFYHSYGTQIFGKGSTIIELKNITIDSNPLIKRQDILMLQLMTKNGTGPSKGICTPPMKYIQIRKGIKFAIDSKMGDFTPLKIWKYHGINSIELGIIDLNLIIFRNRKKYFQLQSKIQSRDSDGIQDVQIYRQQRVTELSHKKQERDILFYHTKQKLRRYKKQQIQVSVSLDCLIYNKRFTNQKLNLDDEINKQNINHVSLQQS